MLRRRVFRLLLVLTLCGVPLWAQAFCFDAAAAKYHVSPLLIKSMAMVEGLSRRDLRRYGAGYESSFLYHHAKRFIKPSVIYPCMLYLSWPTAIYPNLILLPAALLLGASVTVLMSTFKKYL
ncbi:hypothetical protein DK983_17260 [Salmonella enterica]|nr:hypothetical protein [Salmonella enterica]